LFYSCGDLPVLSSFLHDALPISAVELGRELPHFTLHDFRRSGSTHLTGLGVNEEVVEMLLGHKIKGVRGIYMKHKFLEERRNARSEEHTSELQSRENLVCRLLLE